jgi:hypothetical protein
MFLLVGKIPETEEQLKSISFNLLTQNWTQLTYTVTVLTTYVHAATPLKKQKLTK